MDDYEYTLQELCQAEKEIATMEKYIVELEAENTRLKALCAELVGEEGMRQEEG